MSHADKLREITWALDAELTPRMLYHIVAAADYIEELEAKVREQGCKECADLGHHPHCDGYIPSMGELLGDY